MSITGKTFSELTAQQQADMRDQIRGYKVYSAKITQSSTNVPTLTVVENTLGFNPIFTAQRSGAGNYSFVYTPGYFPITKSTINITNSTVGVGGSGIHVTSFINDDGEDAIINILSYNWTFALSDNLLKNTFMEIRVYL